jgi:hypothetical protein
MGERTTDVSISAPPEELEHEVEGIRGNMTGIVKELDRRRHEWLDWRLQLRRHRTVLTLATAGLLLAFGGALAIFVRNKRRRQRPLDKVRRLREAVSRMIEHPEHVARPQPSIGKKALAAAASAAAGTLTKTVTQRFVGQFERVH